MLLCLCYGNKYEGNVITVLTGNHFVVQLSCHFLYKYFSGPNSTVVLNILGLDIIFFNREIMENGVSNSLGGKQYLVSLQVIFFPPPPALHSTRVEIHS